MTIRKNITKTDIFWENIFHPEGDDLIRINSHLLAGQYLKQIEEVLDSRDMKQKDLADKINISPSYLSQLFSGNKLPSWKTLAKVESALDIKFKLMQSATTTSLYRSIDSFSEIESLVGVSMNDNCALKVA